MATDELSDNGDVPKCVSWASNNVIDVQEIQAQTRGGDESDDLGIRESMGDDVPGGARGIRQSLSEGADVPQNRSHERAVLAGFASADTPKSAKLADSGSLVSLAAIASIGPTMKKQMSGGLMLPDADEMKKKIRSNIGKRLYNVQDFYYDTGFIQKIARHRLFEQTTLTVIVINALYMAIDADLNDATDIAKAFFIFQICENLFCFFFFGELLIRFLAFRRKCNCLRDGWFVFDSILVTTMVGETWLMAYIFPWCGLELSANGLGGAAILRILRLLRLSRMSRMARLLRSVPELMILLKGIGQASSSCCWTATLLILATYVWALALKQLTAGQHPELQELYFSSIPTGMYNLMMTGCFMKGFDITMKALKAESALCAGIYFLFVIFSGITIMKMLTGMLCKVINAIAASETEKMSVGFAQDELLDVMIEMGFTDAADPRHVDFENLVVTPEAFNQMLRNPKALEAFTQIGIDVVGLPTAMDFIFPQQEDDDAGKPDKQNWEHTHAHQSILFADFMEHILMLRGSNNATVKDVVDIRKFVRHELLEVERNLAVSIYHQAHQTRELMNGNGSMHGHGHDDKAAPPAFGRANADHVDSQKMKVRKGLPSQMTKDSLEEVVVRDESYMVVRDESYTESGNTAVREESSELSAHDVFKSFCSLSEAERARFFSLLAGGSSHKVVVAV